MDIVKNLEELALASRLKRLGERLAKDVTRIYSDLELDFEAKWFTLLTALKSNSPATITDLAQALGISHTAVNQLASELIAKEYVNSSNVKKDARARQLSITKKGIQICDKLDPVWEQIKIANKGLLEKVDRNFLNTIEALEEELDRSSMYERVYKRIFDTLPANVKIEEYSSKMKKHFKNLNYEWLNEYFYVEDIDDEILTHPKNKIINKGGSILFALMENNVVGTCAIIRHSADKFELAKMAVTKQFRGRGIGRQILESALLKARSLGAVEIYLVTNKNLVAANKLYENFGFNKVDPKLFGPLSYKRKSFVMRYLYNS